MINETILVVDDEEDILELVRYNLSKEGYKVICVSSGEKALQETKKNTPDLLILDLMLPGVDGLDVCKMLKSREETLSIPIIMLTAKGEEEDIITGLQLGADDYIPKPFSPKILCARVEAVLRRSKIKIPQKTDKIKISGIEIDPTKYSVKIDNEYIDLTLTEFKMLHLLARRPGWVFTRYQIVEESRGENGDVTDRSVDVHIVSLRRKLKGAGEFIETVRGIGYRFKE